MWREKQSQVSRPAAQASPTLDCSMREIAHIERVAERAEADDQQPIGRARARQKQFHATPALWRGAARRQSGWPVVRRPIPPAGRVACGRRSARIIARRRPCSAAVPRPGGKVADGASRCTASIGCKPLSRGPKLAFTATQRDGQTSRLEALPSSMASSGSPECSLGSPKRRAPAAWLAASFLLSVAAACAAASRPRVPARLSGFGGGAWFGRCRPASAGGSTFTFLRFRGHWPARRCLRRWRALGLRLSVRFLCPAPALAAAFGVLRHVYGGIARPPLDRAGHVTEVVFETGDAGGEPVAVGGERRTCAARCFGFGPGSERAERRHLGDRARRHSGQRRRSAAVGAPTSGWLAKAAAASASGGAAPAGEAPQRARAKRRRRPCAIGSTRGVSIAILASAAANQSLKTLAESGNARFHCGPRRLSSHLYSAPINARFWGRAARTEFTERIMTQRNMPCDRARRRRGHPHALALPKVCTRWRAARCWRMCWHCRGEAGGATCRCGRPDHDAVEAQARPRRKRRFSSSASGRHGACGVGGAQALNAKARTIFW